MRSCSARTISSAKRASGSWRGARAGVAADGAGMSDLDDDNETIDFGPRQVVHSPEQVALHFPVAGPTSRILAYAVDLVVMLVTEVALLLAVLTTFGELAQWLAEKLRSMLPAPSEDPQAMIGGLVALLALLVLLQVAFEMLYFVAMEVSTGGRS